MEGPFNGHSRLVRVLAVIGLAVSTCVALAQQKDIVVWGPSLGPDSKGLEAAVQAFSKRNPQYRLKLLSMGAGGMNPQKLMTAIVGGTPPDVIDQDRFTISDWAARGAFRPLDDLIARDANTDPETPTPQKYFPAPWHEAMYDGHVYAIPTGADNRALYWNKEIFRQSAKQLREAGLDPNRAPRTWSELLAYSKVLTLKDAAGNVTRPGFIPNIGNASLYMFAFENNASFLSEDGTKCTLASPPVLDALEYMMKAYQICGGYSQAAKIASTYGSDANDPFVTGKVPMYIDGDWAVDTIIRYRPDLEFGVDPAPVPDDRYYKRGRFANEKDRFVTWIGGWSLAVPRGAKNVEGAWAWIKFYLSPEGKRVEWDAQRAWARSRGGSFVPGMQASRVLTQLAVTEYAPKQANIRKAYFTHVNLASVARYRPSTFASQSLWDEQIRAEDEAGSGVKTPKQALEDGQESVQRELDAFTRSKSYPLLDMRVPAVIGGLGAIVGIACYFSLFFRIRSKANKAEARWALVFVTPWMAGFLALTLGPMLASLFFSFTQWNVLNPARYVGWANYADVLGDPRGLMLKSLENVLYVGGIGVPLGLFTSLAAAILLNAAMRGIKAFWALFYMPSLVPTVASAALWLWIMNPDPTRGLANSIWKATIGQVFGIGEPAWFTVAEWARPALIVMGLWGAGGGIILWLAGLKGIAPTLYEAARIDGAGPNKQFWSVTMPQLSPIVFFNTVVGLIAAIQQFDENYLVTGGNGGGPGDSLLTPTYYLFTAGFGYFKMGYASAIAWVIFLVVLILTGIQFAISKYWVHYEVEQ